MHPSIQSHPMAHPILSPPSPPPPPPLFHNTPTSIQFITVGGSGAGSSGQQLLQQVQALQQVSDREKIHCTLTMIQYSQKETAKLNLVITNLQFSYNQFTCKFGQNFIPNWLKLNLVRAFLFDCTVWHQLGNIIKSFWNSSLVYKEVHVVLL